MMKENKERVMKDRILQIRLSNAELDKIKAKAEETKTTVSSLIRLFINAYGSN